jgi:thioredoxin 1
MEAFDHIPTGEEIYNFIHKTLSVKHEDSALTICVPPEINSRFILGYSDRLQQYIHDLKAKGRNVHLDLTRIPDLEKGVLSALYNSCREKAEKEGSRLMISGITPSQEKWLKSVLKTNAEFEVVAYREQFDLGQESEKITDKTVQKPKSRFWKYAAVAPFALGTALAYVLAFQPVSDLPPTSEFELSFVRDDIALKTGKSRPHLPSKAPVEPPVQEEHLKHPKNLPVLPELTTDNIDTIYTRNSVIDVWAPWCGPCKLYEEPFAETAGKYKGNDIYFAKMNIDTGKNRDTIEKLAKEGVLSADIEAIPCTIFMKDGKEVDRFLGGGTERLEEKIKQHYIKK